MTQKKSTWPGVGSKWSRTVVSISALCRVSTLLSIWNSTLIFFFDYSHFWYLDFFSLFLDRVSFLVKVGLELTHYVFQAGLELVAIPCLSFLGPGIAGMSYYVWSRFNFLYFWEFFLYMGQWMCQWITQRLGLISLRVYTFLNSEIGIWEAVLSVAMKTGTKDFLS